MADNFDFTELERMCTRLERFDSGQFCTECAAYLAQMVVAKAKGRTNVITGRLRGSWAVTSVERHDDIYVATVINPVEYAPFVEYGHRKKGGNGWVMGQFILTISVREVENAAPSIIQRKFERKLREVLNGS